MRTTATVLREMGQPGPFAETEPLERVELELDDPGQGELLIRIRAAGLCHSDLSVITGQRPRVMPMALGHEAAGEVIRVGAGDHGFVEGDHVVLAFVPACGECRFCREERPALCEPGAEANVAGSLLGGGMRLHEEGGDAVHHHLGVSALADHAVVSARSAVKVPDDLPFEIAALFGCAVLTGAGAVLNTGASALGGARSIAVFGLGGVGLAALLAAKSQRPETLVAVDAVPAKLELARDLGADVAIQAGPDVVEQVKAATDGGVDLAIETVGNENVLAEAYAATGRGGTTVTAGLPHPSRKLEIPAISLVAEERTLKGSYLGSCVPRRDIPEFIRMYRAGELPVEKLLSHRLKPDEINAGFDRLARGEAVRQIVIFD
ncbi:MAG: zinc-dependent alcohol dehydrogenase family protein [Solirubrobacterales bacterium]|nr:zinc-dependent alcohol dehydrogenase family protein [Solirubrobacterales bacterium]OJU93409.1 MAG: alcohol dehydrogenase [Solirubrobacterales bacterium 67-14]